MPQSHAHLLAHLVFSTKNRQAFLSTPVLRDRMNGFLVGALRGIECPPLEVNCVEDHVHILCLQSRNLAPKTMVGKIKTSSSKFAKELASSLASFYWQNGYGIFSVSQSKVPSLRRYIRNQEKHHRRVSFKDEFRELLRRHNIEFDERYVWD